MTAVFLIACAVVLMGSAITIGLVVHSDHQDRLRWARQREDEVNKRIIAEYEADLYEGGSNDKHIYIS